MRHAVLLALVAAGCTTQPLAPDAPTAREPHRAVAALLHAPLDPAAVTSTPEALTVEDHWLLHLYTRLHTRDYRALRVEFPSSDGEPGVAHLLLPEGPGPHPAVLVFPILGGSHVVSEALAKALVGRGYAALRVERRRLFEDDDTESDFSQPAQRLRAALLDARRLLDWLETRAEIDAERLATAGVSIGGIMAATLMGLDERVRAGFFVMAGGGLAELLYDSSEGTLRRFRERVFASGGARSREDFVRQARVHTEPLDPLRYAGRIDPRHVLLVSGRYDRVVPPERTEELWHALGRPAWTRFPAGHYQILPFFWWSVGRGADLLDRVLGAP